MLCLAHAAMASRMWLAWLAACLRVVECRRMAHVEKSYSERIYEDWIQFFVPVVSKSISGTVLEERQLLPTRALMAVCGHAGGWRGALWHQASEEHAV